MVTVERRKVSEGHVQGKVKWNSGDGVDSTLLSDTLYPNGHGGTCTRRGVCNIVFILSLSDKAELNRRPIYLFVYYESIK